MGLSHSVTTVSTVRAFPPIRDSSDKATLEGLIRAGFENPKESSHGGHGGHGGLRFAVLALTAPQFAFGGSEPDFCLLSSASVLICEICGSP
jgi:hypothetical protein